MATLVETVEREGRTIRVYDNGMEYDMDNKKIIKPPANGPITTRERGQELAKKRHEKTARLLRERIKESTSKISDLKIGSSAAAVAEAGGILWEEIVLNAEAYPRDRLDAWLKLGQLAGVIPNAQQKQEQEKSDAGTVSAVTDLLRELRTAIQQPRQAADVIDIQATDIRNEES